MHSAANITRNFAPPEKRTMNNTERLWVMPRASSVAQKNKKHIATILIASLTITGCANDLPGKWRVVDIHKTPENSGKEASLIDLDAEIIKIKNANKEGAPRQAILELQERLIRSSDSECEKHKAAIIARGSLINFFSGWGATALSSVASISTGGSAKMYSATSTVVNAGRSGYNADIYFGFLTAAIVREIDLERAKRLEAIRTNQTEDDQRYNIERSIKEALDYHYSCSFYTGLSRLVEDKKSQTLPNYKTLKERLDDLSTRSTALQTEISNSNDKKIKDSLYNELTSVQQTKQGIIDLMKIQSQREN